MSPWNSLEVTKVLVAGLTPLIVLTLGIPIARTVRRLDDKQWANRALINRRIELYSGMAPRLNDILCFFRTVGAFQEITPPIVIAHKRDLDKLFYLNRYLLSEEFDRQYQSFMNICFSEYQGRGKAVRIRESSERQRSQRGVEWNIAWSEHFVSDSRQGDGVTDWKVVQERYDSLMGYFSEQLGVRRRTP